MIKKKTSKQNVIIAILCILLIISIVFGFTYSYYNGNSNLVKGTITTANLSIELHDDTGKTSEFSISAPFGEEYLVPGNNLNNVELNIFNKSTRPTYMVVVYTLSAIKVDTGEDISDLLKDSPAISFQENAINRDVWTPIIYECENSNAIYTCLVGNEIFQGKGDSEGVYINVLSENSIKLPGKEWGNVLQNCNVTISITAYAMQAEGFDPEDPFIVELTNAQNNNDVVGAAQIIATKVLQVCQVDV